MPGAGAVRRRCSAAVPASRRSPDPLDFRGSFTLKLLREPYWKAEPHECAVSARRILPPHLSRGRISSAAPSCQEHFFPGSVVEPCCWGCARRVFLPRHGRQRGLPQSQPMFHMGKASMYPRPARLRDLSMALDRPCRYSLPLVSCAENAAPVLRVPLHAA